jgi:hypothetical protein
MTTDRDVSRFREHLTLDECKRLLGFSHWIPVNRGHSERFVEEHYPGWTFNKLVRVFVAAGIYVNRGGAPATCDDRVVSFHFSSSTDYHVEWIDGVEPEDVALKRRALDRKAGK